MYTGGRNKTFGFRRQLSVNVRYDKKNNKTYLRVFGIQTTYLSCSRIYLYRRLRHSSNKETLDIA